MNVDPSTTRLLRENNELWERLAVAGQMLVDANNRYVQERVKVVDLMNKLEDAEELLSIYDEDKDTKDTILSVLNDE